MSLGRRSFTAGNRTRYTIEYGNWLLDGETINPGGTVTLNAEFTATVTDITIEVPVVNSADNLVFFLEGGSVDETFTLDVQIETSMGETKNDTIEFFVVAP